MSGGVVVVVQARMGSTRLPGKVLKTVLGKTLLEHQLERLRRVAGADSVVVATSALPADDAIAALCARLGVSCRRGSESDVLARYLDAARAENARVVVRCTADCPLIDPGVTGELIASFEAAGEKGYGSTEGYPRGLDVEIFSREALEEAAAEATSPRDREHVTPYLIARPERWKPFFSKCEENLSAVRWTVDTAEDFEFARLMIESLYPSNPRYSWRDALALYRAHPEWAKINAHVRQKE